MRTDNLTPLVGSQRNRANRKENDALPHDCHDKANPVPPVFLAFLRIANALGRPNRRQIQFEATNGTFTSDLRGVDERFHRLSWAVIPAILTQPLTLQ